MGVIGSALSPLHGLDVGLAWPGAGNPRSMSQTSALPTIGACGLRLPTHQDGGCGVCQSPMHPFAFSPPHLCLSTREGCVTPGAQGMPGPFPGANVSCWLQCRG